MAKNSFARHAASPENSKWEQLIKRSSDLYERADDIRSPFARDYTRILHSNAYRRLKHKSQVFCNIENDHICTRMEHVTHVESVSYTIAKYLGLNDELTQAIAAGHDLGHAPFGHQGEKILGELKEEYLGEKFWHEKNSVRFVDDIELLADNYNKYRNLDLTYAVRDGIISHCGEVDENELRPREELFDLKEFDSPGKYRPATWEGCIVKISDKIAYVGRDIEDAINLGILEKEQQDELVEMARANDVHALNTTVIMHNMIIDICENSSPERGICLSERFLEQLNRIKAFNYKYIYYSDRLEPFRQYSRLLLRQLFGVLKSAWSGSATWRNLKEIEKFNPALAGEFLRWLARYCREDSVPEEYSTIASECENRKIYGALDDEKDYINAILDYISGMTDSFAVKVFNEMLSY